MFKSEADRSVGPGRSAGPTARRVARILRKVLAAEQDEKATRVAAWGLAQQARRT